MKIYTKTGDSGKTGLWGGQRVSKNSTRIASYGEIDELNSLLGIAATASTFTLIRETLLTIQEHLFILGSQLASPIQKPLSGCITVEHIDYLERQIDSMSETLPELKNFILPGGTSLSGYLHLARSICRRAERSVVTLSLTPEEKVDGLVLIYLNRLSDFLFTLARVANRLSNVDDIPWIPRK